MKSQTKQGMCSWKRPGRNLPGLRLTSSDIKIQWLHTLIFQYLLQKIIEHLHAVKS